MTRCLASRPCNQGGANGMNEARLPRTSEGALARLPATPEDKAFDARPAHPSVLRAGQWWWTGGGLEPTKQYLLSSLRTRPARARSTRHRMGASDFGDPRQRVTSTRPGREWIPGKNQTGDGRFPGGAHASDARDSKRNAVGYRHGYEPGVATTSMVGGSECRPP